MTWPSQVMFGDATAHWFDCGNDRLLIDLSSRQRNKIIAALTLAMMIFTVGFGQADGALFLWAQDRTDRVLLGFMIPAAWFVDLPALLVLLLAPAQLALLSRIQRQVSPPRLSLPGAVSASCWLSPS